MILLNSPSPVPSLVCAPEAVGLCEVLQHTPLAVTGSPPSNDTLPPHLAYVLPIESTISVDTIGTISSTHLTENP